MKGTQLGTYIIEDKLGEGGMGVVYTASHSRLKRKAVIKMLHKHLVDNKDIAKRFENEAIAAASIGHPGIVEIYDIGHAEDGSLYIVMELMQGESLQDRLERVGKLPVDQATSFVRQAAGALAAAHKEDIVHRDLKPDNMFITPHAEVAGGELVKLLDFGIAKLAGDGAHSLATRTGALMGTPHYMSPEQCRGAGGVDFRSDLYSLGCILFQLVTGRTPFTEVGGGDFIIAHVTKEPPLLRTLAPDAPEALEKIVSRLLAKAPDDRFESADALVTALEAVEKADASEATPTSESEGVSNTSAPSESGKEKPPATTLGMGAGPVTGREEVAKGPASLSSSEQGAEGRKKPGGLLVALGLGAAVAVAGGGYGSYVAFSGGNAGKASVASVGTESMDAAPTTTSRSESDAQAATVAVDRQVGPSDAGVLPSSKRSEAAPEPSVKPQTETLSPRPKPPVKKFVEPTLVEASHILITLKSDASPDDVRAARVQAAKISRLARRKGSNFAALAREHSQGPSGPRGGTLGSFGRGKMVKPFESAAFKLRVGQVSGPVKTRFGYHVIKRTK